MSGVSGVHMPVRPSWLCRGCGQPWPCASGREELLDEYRRILPALLVYLTDLLVIAAYDHLNAPLPGPGLRQRFTGWLEDASGRGCTCGTGRPSG